ncbi:reverse transcriptase domain-containing protein, partial [Tanacetum coccineum]
MTRHKREIHTLQDHVDKLPLDRMDTMQQQIDGSYTVAEATQQDMDTLEAALKTCIRALEKRFGPYDSKNSNKKTRLKFCAIEQLIAKCVADALTAYEVNPNSDNGVNDGTSGSVGGAEHTTYGCSYKDFLTCKPCNFNETEGAVGLTRKWDDNQRGNSGQQNKRQEVVRAFTEGSSEKKGYAGTAPHCNRCKLHHNRPYTIQCKNCKRVGQRIGDCKTPTLATAATTQRTSVTFFECGVKGHFRSECPQLKNQGGGNQNGDERAHGRVFVIGGG